MKKTLLKTHSSTCRLGSTQHILGRVEPRLTVHWNLDVWLRLLSSGALAALAPREHSFNLSFSFFSLHLNFFSSSWVHFTTSFQRGGGIHFSCLMFVFGKKVAGTKQCLLQLCSCGRPSRWLRRESCRAKVFPLLHLPWTRITAFAVGCVGVLLGATAARDRSLVRGCFARWGGRRESPASPAVKHREGRWREVAIARELRGAGDVETLLGGRP